MMSSFFMPGRIISGRQSLESDEAGEIFKKCGKKALIVTGPNIVRLGGCSKLEKVLGSENIAYVVFSDINGEPDDEMVLSGLQMYQKNGCDFLIALGGGSAIDLMKAVAVLAGGGGSITDYMGTDIDVNTPNMIAVPTTAGTGSEATRFTIITDTKRQIKMLLMGETLMPDCAILDPQFTMTVPPSVTAATGIDALCHCVEAYTSRKAQTMSDTFAISAVKRIFEYLPVCCRDGGNEQARNQMLLASLEAGIAFNNSSVTMIHGMSRPIGALFHVPHGLSNAVLMKDCLSYALSGAYNRFAVLGREIGAAEKGDSDEMAADKFVMAVGNLIEELNIPTLEEYGINKTEFLGMIEKMADDAMASGSPSNTIRSVAKEDMIKIYQNLW